MFIVELYVSNRVTFSIYDNNEAGSIRRFLPNPAFYSAAVYLNYGEFKRFGHIRFVNLKLSNYFAL